MALTDDADPGVLTNASSKHEIAARLEHQLGTITSGTVTAGTVTASKVVVVDANKDIGDFRNLDATNFDAGLSGTAGSVDIFPSTAAKGKVALTAADSAGDTTTTIVNASQAAARTYTIPDAGTNTNFVMGAGAATVAGAKTFSSALITSANVGTPGTNVTAVEYGDGYNHVTVLTLAAAALTPTIPADAEGAGAIIYTFPAGVYVVNACHMDITSGVMDTATNAADLGVGSLIASGDIATLSTAAMEDYVTGQTVADVSSFVAEKTTIPTAGAPLLFEAAGSHVAHINVAATWNATVATASVTGTVTIHWTFLGA